MNSIIPATKGIVVVEGSDRGQMEMALKNAALWIQYSSLSIGRSCGTELLDNGGLAIVPDIRNDAPRNTAGQEYGEMTGVVVS
jgi:hypothetical protein